MTNATTPTPTITGLVEGTYVFRLTVTDNQGATSFDDLSVIVNPAIVNMLPTANAGGDKNINLPTNSTTLNGSGSDADGSIASYQWAKTSGPSVTMGPATNAVLTLSNLVAGVYEFELTVTDNLGGTGTDVATITVLNANQSPSANAGSNITITLPTNTTNISGSGTDPDGSIASYLWTQVSGPSTATLINETSATLTVDDLAEGAYTFMLTVTDNLGAIGTDEVTIQVNAIQVNEPPVANAGSDRSITLPTDFITLTGSGSDNDGTIATYSWIIVSGPGGSLAGENTTTLNVTAMVAGTYTFELTVTDNEGASDTDEVVVTVQPATVNQSPSADAGGDVTITLPSNTLVLNGSGTDPDGTINSYLWEKVSGPDATLTGTGTATLNLSDLLEGVYVFQLTVMDNGNASGSDLVTVTVNTLNQVPTANAGADITINLPTSSTAINGSGTDTDGTIATYVWAQTSGPTTATLADETTATLTASDLVAGTYIFTLTVTDDDGATANDEVKVIVNAANMAPVADAGINRNITLPTNRATFNGSGTDSDGTIASFEWTQVSGPSTAVMTNATTRSLTVTITVPGTYFFRLTVTDNLGATAFDDARIIVNPENINQLPTANAGANQSITLPTNSINLTGTGSDPDGSIATYAWLRVSGPTATLTNANTATLSLADLLEGTYTFRLTVTDNRGGTASDEVNVTVLPAIINQVPTANAGVDQTITLPTNSLNLTGSGSDPDGTIASYAWTRISGPTATITNGTSAVVSLSDLLEGTYVFRLTVTDNSGATDTDDVTVRVNALAVNQNPTANAGPDRNITLPTNSITLNGTGSDPDGSIASYSWVKTSGPAATLTNATAATLELSDLVEGTYTFRLTVTDNGGLTGQDVMQLIVTPAAVNQAPVANAGSNQTITLPLNSLTIFGSGSDADGTVLTYAWTVVSGTPITLANQNTATLSVSDLAAGSYTLRLTVTDEDGAIDSDDMTITVNPLATNQAPIANAGTDKTITLPTSIATLTGSGSDADGTIASYEWVKVSGPSVTMGTTNLASLSVSDLVEGIYIFRLTVTDDDGAEDSDDVSVTILPATVNAAPLVDAGQDIELIEPETMAALDGNASDTDGSIATIEWTQVQGPVVAISNGNALFAQVNGLTVGTYRFRLTVTDDDGATAFDEVQIVINPANTNLPPAANAGTDKNIKLPTNSTSLTGSATDADGTIASYSWLKLSGPAATMTGENTSTLNLSNLLDGVYQFQLTVTDDDGAIDTDEVTVTVSPADLNDAPVANAGSDISIELPDNFIVINGSATDDDGTPTIAWTQVSGPAATLGAVNTASLSVSNLVAGTYVFRITATDAQTASDFDDVTVTVHPEPITPAAPVVDAGVDISIQLPDNDITIAAEATADDSGFIDTYSWMQLSGPPVMFERADTAVAVINDMVPGTYTFTVTVTDNAGQVASDQITVTVVEEEPLVKPHNLFSPDNQFDGTNVWVIEHADLLDGCDIVVYNRNGQKVYESKGYPVQWDGTYNNRPVPDGAYFYIITCDGQQTQTGSVTIARLK
jgi:gliding motility-associated-like protein